MIDYLFHGTSTANSQSIFSSSLMPRQDKGNWYFKGQVPSLEGMVYLTNNPNSASFYGLRTAILKEEKFYSIIQVNKVDEDNLYPDENYFCPPCTSIYAKEMKEAQGKVLENQKLWNDCLAVRKLVAYKGNIERNKLGVLCSRPIKENIWYFLVDGKETIREFNFRMEMWIQARATLNIAYKDKYYFEI